MVHMRSVDAGQYEHIPVLCDEAICHLNLRNGGRYVAVSYTHLTLPTSYAV